MFNILLQKVKELEKELKEIKSKNEKSKEMLLNLYKECKVNKEKKDRFTKTLLKALTLLDLNKIETFFDDNNALKYASFLEIVKNINSGFLIIVDADLDDEKRKFVMGFLINKISPFFTLYNNKIIGIIDEKQFKDLKSLNKIPYFIIVFTSTTPLLIAMAFGGVAIGNIKA